jgi:hypothetical protein
LSGFLVNEYIISDSPSVFVECRYTMVSAHGEVRKV